MNKVCGVGINDCSCKTVRYERENGVWKRAGYYKAYSTWVKMLRRCYVDNEFHNDVSVSEDWKKFSNFEKWYVKNYEEGYEVDKDILGCNVYISTTCLMIPKWLNNKLRKVRHIETGVWYDKTRHNYQAYCTNFNGVRLNLGRFNSFEDAKLEWAKAKANFIDAVIENNNFKSPVVDGLLKLKNDLLNLNNLNRGSK